MSSSPSENYVFPHSSPPSPSTPTASPPRKFAPTTPPLPAPHHTVIIVVYVSLSCLFLLAFLAAALCYSIKKRKKKKKTQETDVVNVEDRVHVHEMIIPGPHGQQLVAMSVDEDIKVEELIKKNEVVGEASCAVPTVEPSFYRPTDGQHQQLDRKG